MALSVSAPTDASKDRLLSLDVLRGFVVAGMILVTNPGTYAHIYTQLTHAKWNDPTATDLIFPCFLVMVGISMTLSVSSHLRRGATARDVALHTVRRSVLLVVLGIVVNGFPHYDLATIRLPGILQRIGVCYLGVSLIYLAVSQSSSKPRRRRIPLFCSAMIVLAAYWLLLELYPTPGFGSGHLDPLRNIASVLDRAIFTQPHMFPWGTQTPGFGVTFDPEGVLSTLGAVATVLFGVVAGDILLGEKGLRWKCGEIAVMGTALWLFSLALRNWMPLNKQIFTPPFALWSAGLSLIAFAGFLWLIDLHRLRRGWTPAVTLGTNAIVAFCLSQMITSLFSLWHVRRDGNQPLYMVLDAHLFATWLPPRQASLAWALCIVILNVGMIYPLYRKRIFLRL